MDPFVAEIRIFPFIFSPKGWAFCNGQVLPISQNTALFALLGTTYGGDGKNNFSLPNLMGNAPMHPGQGPELSSHVLGETGGTSTVSLLTSEIPAHSHALSASDKVGESSNPEGKALAVADFGVYSSGSNSNVTLNLASLTTIGGGLPHNNMMPYLTFNFNIAIQGIFPPRS